MFHDGILDEDWSARFEGMIVNETSLDDFKQFFGTVDASDRQLVQ